MSNHICTSSEIENPCSDRAWQRISMRCIKNKTRLLNLAMRSKCKAPKGRDVKVEYDIGHRLSDMSKQICCYFCRLRDIPFYKMYVN